MILIVVLEKKSYICSKIKSSINTKDKMKTEFRKDGQNYVMTFEGRLDTPSSQRVGRDMQVLYDCEGHDIVLDCTKLEYITRSLHRQPAHDERHATSAHSAQLQHCCHRRSFRFQPRTYPAAPHHGCGWHDTCRIQGSLYAGYVKHNR